MPRPFIDLMGQTFGRLLAVHRAPNHPSGAVMWYCVCACGGTTEARSDYLRRGVTTSCGCVRRSNQPPKFHHTSRVIEFNGERKTMAQWAESLGVSHAFLWMRLARGWPVDEALSTPKGAPKPSTRLVPEKARKRNIPVRSRRSSVE